MKSKLVILPGGERNKGKPKHRALLEKIARRISENPKLPSIGKIALESTIEDLQAKKLL